MIEYTNSLKNLWQELDHYRVFEMKCSEDTIILKNFIEKDRVYDFVVRLTPKFDQVRGQILGKEETPSLEKTISLIKVEESRRGIMLEPQTLEGSALVTKNEQTQPQKRGKVNLIRVLGRDNKDNMWKDNKDNLWCTYLTQGISGSIIGNLMVNHQHQAENGEIKEASINLRLI